MSTRGQFVRTKVLMGAHHRRIPFFVLLAVGWLAASNAQAQCPTEPRLDNFTGAGEFVCP